MWCDARRSHSIQFRVRQKYFDVVSLFYCSVFFAICIDDNNAVSRNSGIRLTYLWVFAAFFLCFVCLLWRNAKYHIFGQSLHQIHSWHNHNHRVECAHAINFIQPKLCLSKFPRFRFDNVTIHVSMRLGVPAMMCVRLSLQIVYIGCLGVAISNWRPNNFTNVSMLRSILFVSVSACTLHVVGLEIRVCNKCVWSILLFL